MHKKVALLMSLLKFYSRALFEHADTDRAVEMQKHATLVRVHTQYTRGTWADAPVAVIDDAIIFLQRAIDALESPSVEIVFASYFTP